MTSCYEYDGARVEFTGKERDPETGLDFFGARYMSSAQGRFTSPDAPLLDQSATDPQSWNLYTYARNNPLRFVDPTGHAVCSYAEGKTPEGGAASDEGSCSESGGTWVYQPTDTDDPYADADAFYFSVTVEERTGDLDAKGQAVTSELAARADASNQFIGAFAVASAAVGAAGGAAPVAGQAINELAFGSSSGRLFWAGGQVAAGAAAASGQGRVIADSPVGALFARATQSVPYVLQRPGWQILSRFWASGASGTVNVFARNPAPNSILLRTEIPALLKNPNVFKPLQYR